MRYLAIRMAAHRVTALLAVAGAVLGGAALVTGTGVLAESGLRSHLPTGRLSAADIIVSADQQYHPPEDLAIALPERAGVPAGLVGRLGSVPGVTAAVGDLSFPATLIDAGGRPVPAGDPRLSGHAWSSIALLDQQQGRQQRAPGIAGRAPAGAREIALGADLAGAARVVPGDQVQVMADGRSQRYRLAGVVSAPGAGLLFTDATAAQLAGRGERASGERAGTVDLIALRVRPASAETTAAAVRDDLRGRGLTVTTGSSRGDIVDPATVAARSLLVLIAGSLAGIILLIIGFVVAGALAVTIAGQRRELALLRAVGATPRQIRRLAGAQATMVAVLALVPGLPLGYLLAGQFRRMLVDLGMLPAALPLSLSPLPAIAAAALLLIVVQLSARAAAWRASRLPATEAVAESRVEPRAPSRLRTGAGLLLIATASTLAVGPLLMRSAIGAAGTSMAGIVGAIGLALAGPALITQVSQALARRLPAGLSAPTWLAVANIRGYALRLSGIVSTLAMAVVFVLTYTLAQTTLMTATSGEARTGTLFQRQIAAPAFGGLPRDTLATVRAADGVRAAAPVSSTTVLWPHQLLGDTEVEATAALILTPDAPGVLDLDVQAGSLTGLTGETIAVAADLARSRDAEVGRSVHLVLGDGTAVTARVVAVYERALGFGPVVLSHDLAAGHTSNGLDQSILVRTDGSATAERSLAALVAARPGLGLETTGSGAAETTGSGTGDPSSTPPEVWINMATILVLLGYLLLSIANKLVATTGQRRNEIAALRLIGTTPRQIVQMMRREAAVISVAALSAGLALSTIPLTLLGLGFLHRPWASGPLWLLPATVLVIVTIAFVTIEVPTRRALRVAPAHALSLRE
jgi:putative ABC transport system permease protein